MAEWLGTNVILDQNTMKTDPSLHLCPSGDMAVFSEMLNKQDMSTYYIGDTFGRGVGVIPTNIFKHTCPGDKPDYCAGLCYPNCPNHFDRVGCNICKRTSCDDGDIQETPTECRKPAPPPIPRCDQDSDCHVYDTGDKCVNGVCSHSSTRKFVRMAACTDNDDCYGIYGDGSFKCVNGSCTDA